jgi:hypothetical protein
MRLFASKNIGHGVRVGVSEDARRLFGATKTKPRKLKNAVTVAPSEAEQAHADLERAVAVIGRNAAEVAQRVAAHDAALERLKASRAQADFLLRHSASLESCTRMLETVAHWDAQIAQTETMSAQFRALWRTAAANHEEALRRLAANRADLDVKIALL